MHGSENRSLREGGELTLVRKMEREWILDAVRISFVLLLGVPLCYAAGVRFRDILVKERQ